MVSFGGGALPPFSVPVEAKHWWFMFVLSYSFSLMLFPRAPLPDQWTNPFSVPQLSPISPSLVFVF